MIEKIKQLINDGKTKEAYEYAKNEYEKNKSMFNLYILTILDMDFIHNITYEEAYNNLSMVRNKIATKYRLQFLNFFAIAAYEVSSYQEAIDSCIELFKAKIENCNLFYIAANSALNLGKEKDVIFNYANKAIELAEDNDYIFEMAITTKQLYYLNNSMYDEARAIIDEYYLKTTNKVFFLLLELNIEKELLNDFDKLDSIIENIISLDEGKNNINYTKIYYDLAIKCCQKDKEEKALFYINKAIEFSDEQKSFCLIQKGKILLNYNKKEGIELLESLIIDKTVTNYALYTLAEYYRYIYTIDSVKKSIKYFEQLYESTNDFFVIEEIIKGYVSIGEFSQLQDLLVKMENLNDVDDNIGYARILFLIKARIAQYVEGDYKKAQNLLNSASINGYSLSVYDVIDVYKYSKVLIKNISRIIFSDDSIFGYRSKADILFHGKFSNKIDLDKAKEYIDKAIQMDSSYICNKSLLGNILLLSDKDKAFKLFEEGYDSYINNLTPCSCCVAFYAYCLYYGFGTSKNEDKAYEILSEIVKKRGSAISENCYNLYAYFSYERKVNIEDCFNMLQTINNYRYEVGKYYMLIMLGKYLNKKVNKFERKFKENIKKSAISIKKYYNNNPTHPFLTNV